MSTAIAKKGVLQKIRGGWVLNHPPIVDAGINQLITVPTSSVTLTGTATDTDGTVISTLWTKTSGPSCTIVSPSSLSTNITGLIVGTYIFKLSATDNLGRIGSDSIIITVNPVANILPIANINTANLTITLPTNSITLAGSGSDIDGIIVGYLWTKISGPSSFNIVSPTASTTLINNLVAGVYQFQLQVTDDRGGIGVHSAIITVNPAPNILPIANAGGNKNIQLPVNSVTLVGSGTDADGSITGYLWTQVSGPSTATIGNSTLATSTMSALVAGTYVFRLRVTDNAGGQATSDAIVTVGTANLKPIAFAGLDQNLTNANTFTVVGTASDPNGGTIVSTVWSISSITYPLLAPAITINSPTTLSTAINSIGTVGNTYILTLTVTNSFGNTATDSCTIINNAVLLATPVVEAGPNQTVSPPTLSVTLSGSAIDTDGTIISHSWSQVSGPNTSTIISPAAYSTIVTGLIPGTYLFMLTATDNDGQIGSDGVYITVTPNQNPIANAGLDKVITLPTNSVTVIGTGTDPDGTISSYKWTYVSGPATYTIVNSNIASTAISNLIQGVYVFRLTVTDNLGGTATDTMQITVNPAPNILPIANAGVDKVVQLPTSSVTLIGSGTDADGTVVAYQWNKISGPNTPTIVSATSATTVINGLIAGTYIIGLQVTDNSGGLSSIDPVTIIVNPIANIPPTANANIDQTITLPTNTVTLAGSGTDPDGTIASYSWVKVAGSPSSGSITNSTTASTTVTGLVQGVYTFQLTVTDNNGATGTDTVVVTVNAAPPPPIPIAKIALQSAPTVPITGTIITAPAASVALIDATVSPGYPAVAWLWTKISGSAGSVITTPTASTTTITGLTPGTYIFQLQSTIGAPWNYTSSTVPVECRITITVNASTPTGRTFYISTTGNDSNPGTITQPWKTWEKFCTPRGNCSLQPGDTVFIRGGTYLSPHANDGVSEACYWSGINGTSSNYITIQAYPGEYPVLNCNNMTDANSSWPDKYILYMANCSYVKVKGLHLTTIKQIQDGSGVSRGLYMVDCDFVTLEQIEVDHCACNGFSIAYSDDITYINCDSHHNYDSLSSDAGDNADGFGRSSNPSTRTTYIGCRAWLNSDDGWDFIDNPGTAIINNCWSFWNGYGPFGNGEGFKLGFAGAGQSGLIGKVLNNCLAFENKDAGFNNNGDPQCRYQLYNCTAYKNGDIGFEFGYGSGEVDTFKNNISYANVGAAIRYLGANTNNTNNTWNLPVTVNDADFLSVSSVGMDGPRQADGSLPVLNFLRLSPSSDLINKGVNVGLPFNGAAPDLGAFES